MDLLDILAEDGANIKREAKIMKQKGVFGIVIESEAPVVVCDCMAYIRSKGLYNEGVFRVNGNNDRIEAIKRRYTKYYDEKDSADRVNYDVLSNFEKEEDLSIYDVASLLKNYFMKLEEPLIPYEDYSKLCEVYARNRNDDYALIEEINKILKPMISPNRECLGFVISFLREVATFEELNKMTQENLAKIWCMSLMRGKDPMEEMARLGIATGVLRALIKLPVGLYMPSVMTVQKNTKYKGSAPVPPPSKRHVGSNRAPPTLPKRGPPQPPSRDI